jgi:hypothetical protein
MDTLPQDKIGRKRIRTAVGRRVCPLGHSPALLRTFAAVDRKRYDRKLDYSRTAAAYDDPYKEWRSNMRKLFAAIATVMLLVAGSLIWKAEAAMTTGVGGLAPLTKSYTPSENVGYYYRRGTAIDGPTTATAIDGTITAMAIGPITATAIGPIIVVGGISRNARE